MKIRGLPSIIFMMVDVGNLDIDLAVHFNLFLNIQGS